VLGEYVRLQGYALAGALAIVAESPEQVRRAWSDLESDVELVVLTPAAAAALGDIVREQRVPLTVAMTT
jgi:RNase P/RNase MRP subunit p30